MDHSTAKDIAREHAPTLLIDPFNPALPQAIVVRARANGMPFSIHLPTVPLDSPLDAAEAAASERTTLQQSLDSALKALT